MSIPNRFTPLGNRIIDSASPKRSRFGLISKAILPPSQIHELCCVSEVTKIVECAINIANLGTADATVRIWFSTKVEPSDVDVVEPAIIIKPNEVFIRQTFWLSQGEKVFLYSDVPDVVVRLDGYDERKY